MGTDAGVCAHGRNLAELAHLVALGMSPMDAIVAGTANGAALLRLDNSLGTLEAGKIADFVVCDGDPLTDIGVLGEPQNVVVVAKAGVVYKNELTPALMRVG